MVFEPAYGTVLYELEDGVATMTLNVPERLNAFSGQMHADMLETYLEVNRDPNVKVLIITGTGRVLSVGADIKEEAGGASGGDAAALIGGSRCSTSSEATSTRSIRAYRNSVWRIAQKGFQPSPS